MTDRVSSLTLVLNKEWRIDDVEHLINALRQFKQVVDVVPNIQDPYSEAVAQIRCYDKVRNDLYELLEKYRGIK